VSLSAPALTHSVSTTFIEYKCQPLRKGGGGGGATTPSVQLNSIFSAKMDPRENPEKNPENAENKTLQILYTLYFVYMYCIQILCVCVLYCVQKVLPHLGRKCSNFQTCKLCKAIFSIFYNILQPNFYNGIF
jgi:hypothetical protein